MKIKNMGPNTGMAEINNSKTLGKNPPGLRKTSTQMLILAQIDKSISSANKIG